MAQERLLRPREVARQLAVSRSTVYRWFWEGRLRGVKLNGGSALTLAQGDWFVVLPPTNFRYLGMIINGSDNNLVPFYQERGRYTYRTSRQAAAGAINGYTLLDLGLLIPPTARLFKGYARATGGAEVKLAVSYDGSTAALILHGAAPAGDFQAVRGAVPFNCRLLEGSRIYFNNENTANQAVQITGWEE